MVKLKMKDVKFNIDNRKRGIRNNNPANIRHSSSKWLGLSKVQPDKEFCTFSQMEYGVRALLVLLRTYYSKYNCNTIRKVISRFAPSTENNTENYIKFVCNYCGLSPDVNFSLSCCLELALPIMMFESAYFMNLRQLCLIIDKYNLCKSDI